MKSVQLKLWNDMTEQDEKDELLLQRAKELEDFMCCSIKEIGLQAYFAGHLMTDFMMGMLWMADKVSKKMGYDDQKISQLFTEAFNIHFERIIKQYDFHPAQKENPKKGLL